MDAEKMNFSQIPISKDKIRQVFTSPEGQALIRLLQQDGGKGLRAAADSLRRGDAEGAKEALSPLLQNTNGADLAEQLGKKL